MADRERILEWLDHELLGNPLLAWAAAVGSLLLALVALALLRRWVVGRARRLRNDERKPIGKALLAIATAVSPLAVVAVALRIGTVPLDLGEGAARVVRWIVVLALAWQAALWAGIVVETFLDTFVARRLAEGRPEASPAAASMGIFRFLAKTVAYTLVALVALDNLGTDITALVAGLGIGGIAIALAVQNIVGDLFSSISITLDKPFVAGDFITVGDELGTVENIGIKTTRVRSLSGEQLVFGNSDLLASRIRNYGRMRERRVVFSIGVVYQTPLEKLRAAPEMIREIVEERESARFDRSHFKQFGTSSLDIETVYWITDPDYVVFMDVQQAILLEIYRRFEEAGIEFAYPTQTLYLARERS